MENPDKFMVKIALKVSNCYVVLPKVRFFNKTDFQKSPENFFNYVKR